MAKKRVIEFEIGPDGVVTFEGKGFEGAECHDFIKKFENAIGGTKTKKKTAEFHSTKEKVKVRS